ncbi:NAD(P)-binding protein [Cryphonectria parasitica EP155]|uniref:NAD(P)-binding protein n=1 Tax=Cryphonectria parasitica (strain ATCC 38755 / EP155) TaxID=660469 RepID=A0A9P5CQ83_CRYP1|nr:NAD(P)-binding protein [Cryphonectria parasitica EP155]KAF3766953.1 NAD(P)-binding protein [Cryphonectria parasitica EP155]
MASEKKVVLVTGGNTGLGYEAIKALYASSIAYEILLGTRTLSKGQDAIQQLQTEVSDSSSSITSLQVDVNSDASIEAAIAEITSRYGRLDALVNNAGASFDGAVSNGSMTIREAWNTSWDTNVSGTHVLTTLAVPLLLKSRDSSGEPPRLLFITSGTSSLWETEEENWGSMVHLSRINASPAGGWPKEGGPMAFTSYRSTKTGLNMLMREWVRILKNDGVKVWAVSPGFLATNLGGVSQETLRKMGALEPHVGGEFIRDVVQGKHDDRAGKVIRSDALQPW